MSSTDSRTVSDSEANGAARRAISSSSLTVHSSIATQATTCWASTSRGVRGIDTDSMSPLRIPAVTTAAVTRSPRYFGNTMPVLTAPT